MNFLENFHFIRPWWLLLAPAAVGLWWWGRKRLDPLRGWRVLLHPDLLDVLTVGPADGQRWRGGGWLVGCLLGVVAVAGPTWRLEPSPFADDPVPVMLVLRAGESMSQSDLLPNRMERARLKIADFASARRGQPLGLIAYSGSAHLVLPPTRDTAVVAAMAAEIGPDIMPERGDDFAGALRLAERTLGSGGGSIVVVADTITGSEEELLAEIAAQQRLPIHLLGVAREETPELDGLRAAASALNSSLVLLTPGPEDVAELVRRSAQAPISVDAAGEGARWKESGWALVPGIALVVLAGFRRTQRVRVDEVH